MLIQRFSNLEFQQWDALKDATNQLVANGTYGRLARRHFRGNLHRMHGRMLERIGYLRFLPWHRTYLLNLEKELRKIDDSLSIPYWDWNQDPGTGRFFRTVWNAAR